jgi:hypothetical protein
VPPAERPHGRRHARLLATLGAVGLLVLGAGVGLGLAAVAPGLRPVYLSVLTEPPDAQVEVNGQTVRPQGSVRAVVEPVGRRVSLRVVVSAPGRAPFEQTLVAPRDGAVQVVARLAAGPAPQGAGDGRDDGVVRPR